MAEATVESASSHQLKEEFREIALKTRYPNAWAESTKNIPSSDDPILAIIKYQLNKHGKTADEKTLNVYANEYDDLRSDLDSKDTSIDHSRLIEFFLANKGVVKPGISRRRFLATAGGALLGLAAYRALSSPETQAYSGDLLKDVLMPALYQKTQTIRQERSKDSEWQKRVDHELNRRRVNFLALGVGSEKDNEYTDTFLMASYSLETGKLSLISIPRDTHTPEIDRLKKEKGIKAAEWNAINTAYALGGFDLSRKVAEDATGLSADFAIKFKIEGIIDLVNQVFGNVDIKVEEDINDTSKDVINLRFEKGKTYKMDGNLLQDYLRSRSSTSEVARNWRQQRALEQLFEIFIQRFKVGDWNILTRSQSTFDNLQKSPDKRLETDMKTGEFLIPGLNETPTYIQNLVGSLRSSQRAGRSLPTLTKPPIQRLVFQPGLEAANQLTWEERANQIRPHLLTVKNGDPTSPDLVKGYWQPLRTQVKSLLSK